MEEVICKVCNRVTCYSPSDLHISDNDGWYVLCEHCMNEIRIENEKF